MEQFMRLEVSSNIKTAHENAFTARSMRHHGMFNRARMNEILDDQQNAEWHDHGIQQV